MMWKKTRLIMLTLILISFVFNLKVIGKLGIKNNILSIREAVAMYQLQKYWIGFENAEKVAITSGLTISVYKAGTETLATIYSDEYGSSKTNPITPDSRGIVTFYSKDSSVDIRASNGKVVLKKAGVDKYTHRFVFTPATMDYMLADINDVTAGETQIAVPIAYSATVLSDASGTDSPITYNLPLAQVGMNYTFINVSGKVIIINPDNSDKIIPTCDNAGDSLRSDGTVGNYVEIVCYKANSWVIIRKNGTWTDNN